MSAITQLQTTIQTSLGTLSARERRLVGLAVGAVVLFAVFMVTFSFSTSADKIRKRTEAKLSQLAEVQALAANYNQQRAVQEAAERQLAASNIRLISYLEERATRAGIELPTINPKAEQALEGTKIVESGVELTLTDVKLGRLVDFLTAVEAGPGVVKVKYLRLEPRPQSETITAWVTVSTYKLKN